MDSVLVSDGNGKPNEKRPAMIVLGLLALAFVGGIGVGNYSAPPSHVHAEEDVYEYVYDCTKNCAGNDELIGLCESNMQTVGPGIDGESKFTINWNAYCSVVSGKIFLKNENNIPGTMVVGYEGTIVGIDLSQPKGYEFDLCLENCKTATAVNIYDCLASYGMPDAGLSFRNRMGLGAQKMCNGEWNWTPTPIADEATFKSLTHGGIGVGKYSAPPSHVHAEKHFYDCTKNCAGNAELIDLCQKNMQTVGPGIEDDGHTFTIDWNVYCTAENSNPGSMVDVGYDGTMYGIDPSKPKGYEFALCIDNCKTATAVNIYDCLAAYGMPLAGLAKRNVHGLGAQKMCKGEWDLMAYGMPLAGSPIADEATFKSFTHEQQQG